MGLRTVLDAVEERVTAVVAQSGGKQPNFGFGESARFKHEAPPRVTWVPLHGRAGEGDEATTTVRKLWKRRLIIEARIWCDEFDEVETLAAHVFAAFTRVTNRYSVLGEVWDTQGAQGVLKKGVLGVFQLEVRLAFSDEPIRNLVDGTTTPLGVDVTTEIE